MKYFLEIGRICTTNIFVYIIWILKIMQICHFCTYVHSLNGFYSVFNTFETYSYYYTFVVHNVCTHCGQLLCVNNTSSSFYISFPSFCFYLTQIEAGLKLAAVLLPGSECWDYRHEPPYLVLSPSLDPFLIC